MLNRKKKAQHNSFRDSNPELDLNLHSLGTQIVCQEIFVKIASNLFCLIIGNRSSGYSCHSSPATHTLKAMLFNHHL